MPFAHIAASSGSTNSPTHRVHLPTDPHTLRLHQVEKLIWQLYPWISCCHCASVPAQQTPRSEEWAWIKADGAHCDHCIFFSLPFSHFSLHPLNPKP